MRSQFELLVEPLIGGGIDHPDGAGLFIPIADVNPLLPRFIAQGIHVIAKIDGGNEIERAPVVDVQLTLGAAHKKLIRLRRINHALRGGHSGDAVHHCLRADTDNLFRIVSECGNEKPVVRGIDTEMIDAPFYVRQRDRPGQDERGLLLTTRSWHQYCRDYEGQSQTTHSSQLIPPPEKIPRFHGCPSTSPKCMKNRRGSSWEPAPDIDLLATKRK